jgi:hypothetical protein
MKNFSRARFLIFSTPFFHSIENQLKKGIENQLKRE